MKPLSVQVVPALPGFFTVISFEETKEVDIGEPVIAWRVETYSKDRSDNVFSTCIALTVDGDPVSNCIGIQNPDATVTVFEERTYNSLEELRAQRYPK